MTVAPSEKLSKKTYYDSLPRKRSAVGVLFLRGEQVLILKPTYKPTWLVPGGVVDAGESPLAAARRECLEEISLEPAIEKLLVVDYMAGDEDTGDAVHYLFFGRLPDDSTPNPDGVEIEGFEWVHRDQLRGRLGTALMNRLDAGFESLRRGQTVYCENGVISL